jgi:hypothetical protein
MKRVVEMGSDSIHTKFHRDWFSHSKVDRRGLSDTQIGDLIRLLLFYFLN